MAKTILFILCFALSFSQLNCSPRAEHDDKQSEESYYPTKKADCFERLSGDDVALLEEIHHKNNNLVRNSTDMKNTEQINLSEVFDAFQTANPQEKSKLLEMLNIAIESKFLEFERFKETIIPKLINIHNEHPLHENPISLLSDEEQIQLKNYLLDIHQVVQANNSYVQSEKVGDLHLVSEISEADILSESMLRASTQIYFFKNTKENGILQKKDGSLYIHDYYKFTSAINGNSNNIQQILQIAAPEAHNNLKSAQEGDYIEIGGRVFEAKKKDGQLSLTSTMNTQTYKEKTIASVQKLDEAIKTYLQVNKKQNNGLKMILNNGFSGEGTLLGLIPINLKWLTTKKYEEALEEKQDNINKEKLDSYRKLLIALNEASQYASGKKNKTELIRSVMATLDQESAQIDSGQQDAKKILTEVVFSPSWFLGGSLFFRGAKLANFKLKAAATRKATKIIGGAFIATPTISSIVGAKKEAQLENGGSFWCNFLKRTPQALTATRSKIYSLVAFSLFSKLKPKTLTNLFKQSKHRAAIVQFITKHQKKLKLLKITGQASSIASTIVADKLKSKKRELQILNLKLQNRESLAEFYEEENSISAAEESIDRIVSTAKSMESLSAGLGSDIDAEATTSALAGNLSSNVTKVLTEKAVDTSINLNDKVKDLKTDTEVEKSRSERRIIAENILQKVLDIGVAGIDGSVGVIKLHLPEELITIVQDGKEAIKTDAEIKKKQKKLDSKK